MKKPLIIISVWLFTTLALAAQTKKSAPLANGAATAAAKICANLYDVEEPAQGWPEAPVVILFHREKSKAPWTRTPAIRVPSVEAAAAASARTVVCVEESLLEEGKYESGAKAYTPSWDITLVRLSDRKVFFGRTGFYGKEPPGIKFHKGAGVGAAPTKLFAEWLPLVVGQKIARFRTKLPLKEFHEIYALAFSGDGSRLTVSQQPRSTSDGTPPSPVTVFDVSSGKTVAAWNTDYLLGRVAISQSGNLVATERYGHPEVWDVASAHVVHKLDTSKVELLLFGPGDLLGTAGGDQAAVWDLKTEHTLHSGKGSGIALSPSGEWLALQRDRNSTTVQSLDSGRTVGTFPAVPERENYALSGDGQAMARTSMFGAYIAASGSSTESLVSLPDMGVGLVTAMAPTRDGFVFGNSNGIVGLATVSSPQPRAFATDQGRITALAVSPDGKLLAVGDSFGKLTVWELR